MEWGDALRGRRRHSYVRSSPFHRHCAVRCRSWVPSPILDPSWVVALISLAACIHNTLTRVYDASVLESHRRSSWKPNSSPVRCISPSQKFLARVTSRKLFDGETVNRRTEVEVWVWFDIGPPLTNRRRFPRPDSQSQPNFNFTSSIQHKKLALLLHTASIVLIFLAKNNTTAKFPALFYSMTKQEIPLRNVIVRDPSETH